MKSIVKNVVFVATLFAANLLHAQLQLSSADLAAIEATTPSSVVPLVGVFYSAANPLSPPAPADFFGYQIWSIDSSGDYLLDDLGGTGGFHAMDEGSSVDGFTNEDGGYMTNYFSYSPPTNGLWMEITNASYGIIYANINGATDYVYAVLSSQSLGAGMTFSNWNIETEVFGSGTNPVPFYVAMNGRNSLFLSAMDWTGVTNNGNLTPSWWFYFWYGVNGLSLSDYNLDSQGNTLLYDYQNGIDPNIINFYPSCTNQRVNFSDPSIQLNIMGGTPYFVAVLVDDTNQADANWTVYASSNITANLGSIEGWHNICVGLKGFAPTSFQTWETLRLKLDLTPPLLAITNLVNSTVTEPVIQLQGYSDEALSSISYDLTNATGLVTNQQVLVFNQYYDTNTLEFTTNYFQCFDVPVTNGLNIVTMHATDLAGNETATNFSFTLDYSSVTNPPTIQLNWPQNGSQISSNSFTWRGCVNEATAQIIAQIVNTNGVTNSASGQVGRNGDFWVYNLPLSSGSNYLSLTATDAAGNTSSTNIVVTQSALVLTITSAALGQPVQGTISDWTNYTVWVNGVIATNNGNGTWIAYPNLTLDTPVVQVRAIPNSDNGGYGGGQ